MVFWSIASDSWVTELLMKMKNFYWWANLEIAKKQLFHTKVQIFKAQIYGTAVFFFAKKLRKVGPIVKVVHMHELSHP